MDNWKKYKEFGSADSYVVFLIEEVFIEVYYMGFIDYKEVEGKPAFQPSE